MVPNRHRSEERRAGHEGRYRRDWSSDVCSSDLEAEFGDLVMNLDKGDQSQGGADAIVLSDLAAAGADCDGTVFAPKRFDTGPHALAEEADHDGNPWSLIGTDRKSVAPGTRVDIGVTGVQTCALPILRMSSATW